MSKLLTHYTRWGFEPTVSSSKFGDADHCTMPSGQVSNFWSYISAENGQNFTQNYRLIFVLSDLNPVLFLLTLMDTIEAVIFT
jgi:hypothetical protein